MKKHLIVVESPAKIKTLKKFLGREYQFASSVGHIRDLPTKGFGIDTEGDFDPEYELMPDKKDVISKLKKAAKESDTVYLAPDPDREGEAIAWHIASILPPKTKIQRISFNEITRDAVQKAIQEPREIDYDLVNAQQARRLLDRIVGYKISPILQRKIQKGRSHYLSAGRVQSVALKLVVEREKEIEAFIPIEYWTLTSDLLTSNSPKPVNAFLYLIDGKKIEKELGDEKKTITIPNEETAEKYAQELRQAEYTVQKVEKKEKKRRPVPPFITSTLQQEASRHFGFSASRTMRIAQSLYEGVDLGADGSEGLITYMRTDSVRISPEAQKFARDFVKKTYGKEFVPEKPNVYSSKAAAQDAHEAIRPTGLTHPPQSVQSHLTRDQFRLYDLIWKRFLASQMTPAIYDTVSCDISAGPNLMLRANGSVIKFQGFLAVYEEKQDSEIQDNQDNILPPLTEGEKLKLCKVDKTQSFTRPPPRYTEASLVKELEKQGIGRPSTYATIMNKIHSREYTEKQRSQLKPTQLGLVITQMLQDNFTNIMDVKFTARMEEELDEIANGKIEWKNFIKEFWDKFIPLVETAQKEAFVPKIDTDITCPQCKKGKLQKIWSRNKYFYGCNNYPDCDFTSPLEALNFNKDEYAENFDWDQNCPRCSKPMKLRHGRYGPFLGCSDYPNCNGIVNIPKKGEPLPEEMPDCPAIGCPGKLVKRRSRFGKDFFSCSTYPDCDVIANSLEQIEEKYPNHPRTPYVKKKKTKKGASTAKKGKKKAASGAATRTYPVSEELAAVIGKGEYSRGEVIKKVWDYIKKHDLQNPDNKRQIVPDDKLAKVFGSKKTIDMMKMSGLLSPHIKK